MAASVYRDYADGALAQRRPLQKQQKNQIFQLLVALGLDPNDFRWDEGPTFNDRTGDIAPVLRHESAGFWFMFGSVSDSYQGGRYPIWSPPDADNRSHAGSVYDWDTTIRYFARWAEMIKAELEAPDLWSEVAASGGVVRSATDVDDNSPFTKKERELLKKQLAELQAFVVETYSRSAQDTAAIEIRFTYVAQAPERGLGRKDWLNIFVSQIINLLVTGLVPSTAVRDILAKAQTLLAPLFAAVAGWLQ